MIEHCCVSERSERQFKECSCAVNAVVSSAEEAGLSIAYNESVTLNRRIIYSEKSQKS